jgi:predicted RNA-binding protein YlqC (UPF0109 family)
METLIRHLVEPIVAHKDAVSIRQVDGESVVLLELVVHPDDREVLEGNKGRTLRSIRQIVSAAAGQKKASVDLVEEHGSESEEE